MPDFSVDWTSPAHVGSGADGSSAQFNEETVDNLQYLYERGLVLYRQTERTSGDITLAASTAWKNVDTALDIVLSAVANDVIEVVPTGCWFNDAAPAYLDICTVVSGSPVSYFLAFGGASDVPGAWGDNTGGTFAPITGPAFLTLAAPDISAGTVTLRLRARQNTATTKKIQANTFNPLRVIARNHGQAAP